MSSATKTSKSPSDALKRLSKEKLIELIVGTKPDISIGEVHIDGSYPASQFHLSVKGRISEENKEKIKKAIEIPFCGLIHCQIFGSRIIITTTCPAEERSFWVNRFAEVIELALSK